MLMDIVLIPGALATPKFWHHQEAHWHGEKHIHHVAGFLGQSIPDIAEKLIETLPKKFTLIGFSLGGYIALELIQRIPHQIDKLILINSGARALSEKGQIERERSIELINNGKFDFLINLIFKNSVYDKNKHHELPITTMESVSFRKIAHIPKFGYFDYNNPHRNALATASAIFLQSIF